MLEKYDKRDSIQDEYMFLKRVILWYGIYAMLSYAMVWYDKYGVLCYDMKIQCYAMVYVVKDKHSATV